MPTNSSDIKDTRPGFAKKNQDPDQTKWNLAKAHLKSKDFDLARKILIELTDHPNPFNLKATKALQEMNK